MERSVSTIERVRCRWASSGLDDALARRPPGREDRCKLDGAAEAHLLALAGSTPPAGRQRWSLRLLADKLVALDLVETIAPNTVRTVLKKTHSSPG